MSYRNRESGIPKIFAISLQFRHYKFKIYPARVDCALRPALFRYVSDILCAGPREILMGQFFCGLDGFIDDRSP